MVGGLWVPPEAWLLGCAHNNHCGLQQPIWFFFVILWPCHGFDAIKKIQLNVTTVTWGVKQLHVLQCWNELLQFQQDKMRIMPSGCVIKTRRFLATKEFPSLCATQAYGYNEMYNQKGSFIVAQKWSPMLGTLWGFLIFYGWRPMGSTWGMTFRMCTQQPLWPSTTFLVLFRNIVAMPRIRCN